MNVGKLWEKIKKIMKKRVSEAEFEAFFKNVEATKLEDNKLTLVCNSKLIQQNVGKYKGQMEEIAEIITDEIITIDFEIKKQDIMSYKPEIHSFSRESKEKSSAIYTGLNPKHRFDNFIVGENSKLAYNACLAVVNNPTPVYNPLFRKYLG